VAAEAGDGRWQYLHPRWSLLWRRVLFVLVHLAVVIGSATGNHAAAEHFSSPCRRTADKRLLDTSLRRRVDREALELSSPLPAWPLHNASNLSKNHIFTRESRGSWAPLWDDEPVSPALSAFHHLLPSLQNAARFPIPRDSSSSVLLLLSFFRSIQFQLLIQLLLVRRHQPALNPRLPTNRGPLTKLVILFPLAFCYSTAAIALSLGCLPSDKPSSVTNLASLEDRISTLSLASRGNQLTLKPTPTTQ
jgi:hypothetical protein